MSTKKNAASKIVSRAAQCDGSSVVNLASSNANAPMVTSAVHLVRSSSVKRAFRNAALPMLTRFCGLTGNRRLVISAF